MPAALFLATVEAIALLGRAPGGRHLVPHLTHRTHIYGFPNPWVTANWGLHGENPPDPATIDYLVVDTQALGHQRGLYERLVGPDRQFRMVFAHDGIVMARRAVALASLGRNASPV